ncbi:uncharacterized protein SPAPADRAFT_154950 [Spathaspora passalidarum NRRL Y-27907]|uniref:DUF1765-domain-containing protein n=1 Tax=Spathaspora passalidarum (strain NRRL Y-27907 / 11-Y1) TaxID=619300 RepID=G3AQN3_SPAPN|nr:uncharacterized protein SPAPADRAFT_154950 [Spathaspora passalidarum NRRL Y-27907]EGW31580.1 hypothetical protein SPAPADRAFT_154950 [Spathaspora passalidarum NRRL Y-27907]
MAILLIKPTRSRTKSLRASDIGFSNIKAAPTTPSTIQSAQDTTPRYYSSPSNASFRLDAASAAAAAAAVANTTTPTVTRSNSANSISSPDTDKLIKSLLKQFKKLEVELHKFNSRKFNHNNNGVILKGNILRTSLLPFLRTANQLNEYFSKDSPIYISLTSVIVSILIKWWNSLIGNLVLTPSASATSSTASTSAHVETIHYSNISASDRNAYLECISRIISREEWKYYQDDTNDYNALLIRTLDYCIDKMSTFKTLSASFSAFIGKVFAYSFFKLPNVSNALLFLLNVKQITFETCMKRLTGFERTSIDKSLFAQHLHSILNYNGISTGLVTKGQKSCMNCMPTPKHPVKGIKDPNGDWVRRWCCSDSNVFNSFFRHYIDIIQKLMEEEDKNVDLISCPGFTVIITHVFQILQVAVARISNNYPNPTKGPIHAQTTNLSPKQQLRGTSDKILPPLPPPVSFNINMKQSDIYYNSFIKIFKTIRDIAYCATLNEKSIDGATASLVRMIDLCLISMAKETSVYDFNKNGLIMSIANEFINHIVNNNPTNEVSYLINWEFWLGCNYMMIKHSDHVQIILKNFAFLFNIWDMIPETLSQLVKLGDGKVSISQTEEPYKWLTNLEESFKVNFINFLTGSEMFQRFFCHWNPVIRSYYIRLLVWRIIGVNNYQSSTMIRVTRQVQMKLNQAFDVLHEFTNANNGKFEMNYKSDNPLVNRRFGILPINVRDDYLSINEESSPDFLPPATLKSSELKKTHPYEVFDEAIYTCSSSVPPEVPRSSSAGSLSSITSRPKSSSNPIVSSLGKLLRMLSVDDNNSNQLNDIQENGTFDSTTPDSKRKLSFSPPQMRRNSVSLTSLSSTYSSLKSRSSSPSMSSYKSTTTVTDSTSSSIQSDSESLTSIDTIKTASLGKLLQQQQQQLLQSYNIPPPELSRLPPDIVRPIYKFDIVVDHESLNEKYNLIQQKNALVASGIVLNGAPCQPPQISYFPMPPQLPFISIFINSESFSSNFYINEEDSLFFENYETDVSEDEVVFDRSLINMVNLGKSLNELNMIIEEFRRFLNARIEVDSFNMEYFNQNELNEFVYFKKIIPFLSIDSSNELKLLNAS